MAYTSYHTRVQFTANSNVYTIPIWALRISAVPYSGLGTTTVRLFDGRNKQRVDGWLLRAEFDWPQLKASDHDNFTNLVNDIVAAGTVDIDFDPDDNLGQKVATFVAEDLGDMIQALFRGRVRRRPAAAQFIGSNVLSEVPDWILGGTFDFSDADDIYLFTAGSIVSSGGTVSAWTDLSGNGETLDTQSQAAAAPVLSAINGQNSIKFNNSSDNLWSTNTGRAFSTDPDDDAYLWIVMLLPNAGNGIWYDGTNPSGLQLNRDGLGKAAINNGGSNVLVSTTSIDDGNPHIIELKMEGSSDNWELWIDGTQEDTEVVATSISTSSSGRRRAGDFADAVTNGAENLELSFVKAMSSIPDAARLSAIRAELASMYGITLP